MNPRQRKGMLFLVIAVIGAIAVFFSVVSYVNDVESQVGNRVTAYVVKDNVEAYQSLTPDDLEHVEIPERWLPEGSVDDLADLTGRVTSAPLTTGTLLQEANLVPQPGLAPGQREIAIMVDAETGVAGKVSSGDRVDIWATFGEEITVVGPRSKVIAQDLLIIDIGVATSVERETNAGGFTEGQAVPVTFAVEEGQVKALTFAETFATQTRLVLRPPGDDSQVPPESKTYVETFPQGGNS